MSVFTNPASGAREHGERYVAAVLDLVEGEDPRGILATTVEWCDRQTSDLPTDQLARAEALARLLRDRALRDEYAERGLARSRAFSWARSAADTLQVLAAAASA